MAVAQISWLQLGEAEPATAQLSWLQIDGAPAVASQVALLSWLQIDGAPVAAIPNAPTDVEGAATGGTTATSTWVDASTNETGFLVELSDDDGATWVYEYTFWAGVTTMDHVGLTPATMYRTGVTALGAGGNSARAVSAPWWTDNTGGGGSEIPLPDAVLPTLTGDITVTNNTTGTSYTLTSPAGADNVAVAGYEYSLNGGAYVGMGGLTVNVTGRTAGATDAVLIRCYDAWGNRSTPPLSVSVELPFVGPLTDEEMREMLAGVRENARMMRIILAAVSGKTAGLGSSTETYFGEDGTTARIVASFDNQGNRTAVATDGTL